MEKIFDGYSEACSNAVLESRKIKDKVFYVLHKVVSGVKYALTDDEKSTGNLLQSYQNGMVYVMRKEVPVKIEYKEEPKSAVAETKVVEPIISAEVKELLNEQSTSTTIEQPSLNGTESKEENTPVNE